MGEQIQCPHCGQPYALSDEQVPQYAGQTIHCTRCKQPFTVADDLGQRDAGAGAGGSSQPPPLPGETPAWPTQHGTQHGAQPDQFGGYAPSPYGSPHGAYVQPNTGLAVAAMVIALVGLVIPFVGIAGLILGIVALVKTKDPRFGGRGFAIAGIGIGLLSLVMGMCVLSVLVPSFTRARENSRRVQCAAQLRQIGQAILLYCNDNGGQYPDVMDRALAAQGIVEPVKVCPADDAPPAGRGAGHSSYVYVGARLTLRSPASAIVAYEPIDHHGRDGANFLWADGHVSFESPQRAQNMIAQLESGTNPPK